MKLFHSLLFTLFSITTALSQKPNGSIIPDCNRTDQAIVIFYRKFSLFGSALGFELYHNDSLLTKIRTNTFYVAELPQGKNTISSQTGTFDLLKKNKNTQELNLKPRHIYFVRCKTKPFSEGIIKPRYKLLFKVLSEKEVKKNIKSSFLRKKLKRQLYHDFVNLQ
jgi:hypothetical protein